MQINGFNKLTLLDFPKHLAATIFVGGCNMRCPFCHNASLVTDPSSQPIIPVKEVLDLLAKRKGILEGVCITGGEPTLYSDLPDLIRQIKSLGLAVKIDTNGTNPRMIKSLVDQHLIDYVAMDIKNSKENYELTSGIARIDLAVISESVSYLLADTVDYEFRTTVVKEYHTAKDILSIGNWIKGAKAYYLQSYQDSGDIISTDELHALPKETLNDFIRILTPYIKQVSLRGVD